MAASTTDPPPAAPSCGPRSTTAPSPAWRWAPWVRASVRSSVTAPDRADDPDRTQEVDVPVAVQAGLWGLLAGGALVVGAAIAWVVQVPQKVVAGVMAFGAGVLISALAFDLVDEA